MRGWGGEGREGRGTSFQSRQNHTRPDPLAGASRLHTVALAPLFKRRPAPNEKLVAETQRRSLAPPGARETLIVREVGSGVHDAIPGTDSEDDRRRTVLRRYTLATMLRAQLTPTASALRRVVPWDASCSEGSTVSPDKERTERGA